MLARLSRRGRGQMPPLVSQQVDQAAVTLFREWISSMKPEREFVRDWSMADFEGVIPKDTTEQSLEQGRALFKLAGCGQCHRIEEEIAGIGPNLRGISKRLTPQEILQSILEPSAKIDPKYAATIVVTRDGRTIQGRVQSETEVTIVLRGSDSFAEPQTIQKSDIEERLLSRVSMMPNGTVNHLQRSELLALLAYVFEEASEALNSGP